MSIMAICTLGIRDILLNNELISPPREKGKRIFEHFDDFYLSISYPIIRPVLDYIFYDKKYDRIDRVILVATDQNEGKAEPRHRNNDTIEFAKLLRRILERDYGEKKINEIRIVKIPQHPNFIDEMFDFFGVSLKSNKAFQMKNLDVCYIEQAGGIPSANMALLFQCINKFREKCSPIYVSEKTGAAHPIRIGADILREYRKTLLLELVRNFDYAAMSDHLDDKSDDEKFISTLCQYARHRLYFDVSTAQSIARQAVGEFRSSEKNMYEDFLIDLKKLEQRNHAYLIAELFHNIVIKYIRREFVDFLGRLYRFKEAVLTYFIETALGITTEMDMKTGRPAAFFQWVENNYNFQQFVKSEKTRYGTPIDIKNFGVPLLMVCFKYLKVRCPKTSYQKTYNILQKIENLLDLRNRSIIGHGFRGVSENIIREQYDGEIIDDLGSIVGDIFHMIGISRPDNHRGSGLVDN